MKTFIMLFWVTLSYGQLDTLYPSLEEEEQGEVYQLSLEHREMYKVENVYDIYISLYGMVSKKELKCITNQEYSIIIEIYFDSTFDIVENIRVFKSTFPQKGIKTYENKLLKFCKNHVNVNATDLAKRYYKTANEKPVTNLELDSSILNLLLRMKDKKRE